MLSPTAQIVLAVIFLVILLPLIYYKWKKSKWKTPNKPIPTAWKTILEQRVDFYRGLPMEERKSFDYKVQEFLLNCRITGIKMSIDDTDKLLVAASAVIPIFHFPKWRYSNLFEVLLYPAHFNHNFETAGEGRNILGMVGTGYMEGKMILSKQALHHGFDVSNDKRNTALHEFVHLIDKMDGSTDGVPHLLLEKPYVIPWLHVLQVEMESIYNNTSDINPYGGTNKAEFFAVAAEYFFEKPKLLESKHPKLYDLMEDIFNHDMTKRKLGNKKNSFGRNSPCPCGSDKKFKKCCGE